MNTLKTIGEKIEAGRRISAADGEFLFRDDVDLHAVGELADLVRRRKHGDVAYYNVNAHLNPTNVCIYQCALCAYSRECDDPSAYTLGDEEILAQGQEADDNGCTELHVVGGVHPEKPFDWYLGIVRQLHDAFPRLHLKAWTASEIAWFSQLTRRTVHSILVDLMRVGLGSLPGGGAEIFDPQVRNEICPRKVDARTWLGVHRAAHEMGLRSNATMLYGHLENAEHRIDHLVQLRLLQDVTGGFQAFIPLAFHPENTRLSRLSRASSLLDLRTMAVSRLMLDNFDHVKAYWISLGVGTAQVALGYGANDIDGTVRREQIHHTAGSDAPESLSIDQLRHLIVEAGREPVERDTLYRRVKRDGTQWTVE
ncbi:MAG TPA: aminofutalosine synthase MqnE [Thermoguttaceae bacterium]|nr:aminofutalosine synthase MqnE [Thermoguttaceae bacterium]